MSPARTYPPARPAMTCCLTHLVLTRCPADFFVGTCGWGPGQLQAELARGNSWYCAATSPELLLAPRRAYQPSLWREALTLMGGEYSDVASRTLPVGS